MYLISVKCGVTLDLLRKASGIASNVIYPGQILLLPGGANTAAAGSIAASTASTTTADKYVVPCTTAEFDQLARLVTAEAAGEPYQAQVAVAAVVINRVSGSRMAEDDTFSDISSVRRLLPVHSCSKRDDKQPGNATRKTGNAGRPLRQRPDKRRHLLL